MEKIIGALIDNGYELVSSRDHLYTFGSGCIVIIVNTHALTGGYALSVILYKKNAQKQKHQRINSLNELYHFMKTNKKLMIRSEILMPSK